MMRAMGILGGLPKSTQHFRGATRSNHQSIQNRGKDKGATSSKQNSKKHHYCPEFLGSYYLEGQGSE